MSSKRRQCRNRPDVFCYICWGIYAGKVPLQRERFHQKCLQSLLWHKVRGPRQVLGPL